MNEVILTYHEIVILKDGSVPTEIQISPYGTVKSEKGTFILDEKAISDIENDLKSRQKDIVVDYEHASLGSEPNPAAGWIKPSNIINKGKEGLWAIVEWTERAIKFIKNKEYRYLSPVFFLDKKTRRVKRFFNAALTHNPAIDNIQPIVNSLTSQGGTGMQLKEVLDVMGIDPGLDEKLAMSEIKKLSEGHKSFKEEILKGLGINKDATVKDVLNKVAEIRSSKKEDDLTKDKEIISLKSEIDGLMSTSKEIEETLLKIQKEKKAMEAEKLVKMALKDDNGKARILPSQKEWAVKLANSNPEAFKDFLKSAPVMEDLTSEISGQFSSDEASSIQVKFNELVDKKLILLGGERNEGDRYKAMQMVAKENPKLSSQLFSM